MLQSKSCGGACHSQWLRAQRSSFRLRQWQQQRVTPQQRPLSLRQPFQVSLKTTSRLEASRWTTRASSGQTPFLFSRGARIAILKPYSLPCARFGGEPCGLSRTHSRTAATADVVTE